MDETKITLDAYNKFAEYYSNYTYDKISQYHLTQLMSYLNGKKVLDAGCGSGRDVQYLTAEGLKVVGIDYSDQMISQAKKRFKKGNFRVMDFEKMEFPDASFNGIWCCASLIHIPKRNLPNVLKEFSRILSDDGILYVSVKDGEGERMIRYKKLNHEKALFVYFTQQEIENFLSHAGFTILHSSPEEVNSSVWINIYARKS
ncbi:MAG: methyltransferase domain-containing protein [archaeon]